MEGVIERFLLFFFKDEYIFLLMFPSDFSDSWFIVPFIFPLCTLLFVDFVYVFFEGNVEFP